MAEALKFKAHIPFVELLGMELLRFDPGVAEIALPIRDALTNSWGVAHGGVSMTLLDVVMAHAARTPTTPDGEAQPGVVTVEMKTTFMRPAEGRLLGQGRLLHRTASLAFCEGDIRDDKGIVVAHATGTFKYMRGLPANGRKIRRLNASD